MYTRYSHKILENMAMHSLKFYVRVINSNDMYFLRIFLHSFMLLFIFLLLFQVLNRVHLKFTKFIPPYI